MVKIYLQCRRPLFNPCVGKIPWRSKWQTTPIILPGKSHGQRNLVYFSPWGRKELDRTERQTLTKYYLYANWKSLVGYSPWVAQSQTQLSGFTFTFHFHALEKEMATHSSVLAWRIPGMTEPGGLPSMGSHRVGRD